MEKTQPPVGQTTMRLIALEEHFATPAFMNGPGDQLRQMAASAHDHPGAAAGFQQLTLLLSDLGAGRIAAMDSAGIDCQVLSLTSPGVQQLGAAEAISIARNANELLAAAIKKYPGRFEGFATLPTADPVTAAAELQRVVDQYAFKGALINGHTNGRYLDDPFFWPILEAAEALNTPIYLHPTPPTAAVITALYKGNYSPEVVALLATGGWGWHIETAVHVLRLILGGVFDRFPALQLVIGHLGEALPFMLPRIGLGLPKEVTKLQRSMGEYLRENLHYTFGGFNYTQTFLDLLLQVGPDRILFSTDYPYASMPEARAFLENLPISPADKIKIAHGNAERLLRMPGSPTDTPPPATSPLYPV